jgi:hypothetical protein
VSRMAMVAIVVVAALGLAGVVFAVATTTATPAASDVRAVITARPVTAAAATLSATPAGGPSSPAKQISGSQGTTSPAKGALGETPNSASSLAGNTSSNSRPENSHFEVVRPQVVEHMGEGDTGSGGSFSGE